MRKGIILRFLFLAAVMAFIYIQSSYPDTVSSARSAPIAEYFSRFMGVSIETSTFIVRKSAHFLEYCLLGASAFSVISVFFPAKSLFGYLFAGFLSWTGGTLYAVTDEIHQRFVSGRSGELRDVAIDAAGVFVGILIFMLIDLMVRYFGEKN